MRNVVLGHVLVMLAVAGCASPQAPAIASSPTPTGVSITQELGSGEYPLDLAPTGAIRLTGGEYAGTSAPGSATKLMVRLTDAVATGDLNGDGLDDAAVVLLVDPGGSGTFSYLAAALNKDGGYHGVASALLGDRIEVKSVEIHDGAIEVTMLDRAPGQPMASPPTLETTRTFQLRGSQLVQVP